MRTLSISFSKTQPGPLVLWSLSFYIDSIEEGNPYEQFGNTHKVVSCLSSVWRVDGSKRFLISNMTSRFINSNKNKSLKFIRARTTDETKQYVERNKGTLFELFLDEYDNYFDLVGNDTDKMTVWQFVSHFDASSGEHSPGQGHPRKKLQSVMMI